MQHLSLTCELIERAFGQALPLDLPVCEQALRQRLTGQLQQWIGQGLREQPEQLVQTCYRIDLPEEQFHAAMMARPASRRGPGPLGTRPHGAQSPLPAALWGARLMFSPAA